MFTDYLITVVMGISIEWNSSFLMQTPSDKIIPFFLPFYVLYNNVKKRCSST